MEWARLANGVFAAVAFVLWQYVGSQVRDAHPTRLAKIADGITSGSLMWYSVVNVTSATIWDPAVSDLVPWLRLAFWSVTLAPAVWAVELVRARA